MIADQEEADPERIRRAPKFTAKEAEELLIENRDLRKQLEEAQAQVEQIEAQNLSLIQRNYLQRRALERLRDALRDCSMRFRSCVVHSGTDEEFADIAVKRYEELIK